VVAQCRVLALPHIPRSTHTNRVEFNIPHSLHYNRKLSGVSESLTCPSPQNDVATFDMRFNLCSLIKYALFHFKLYPLYFQERDIEPNKLAGRVTLPIFILEMPGSNLGRNTSYRAQIFRRFPPTLTDIFQHSSSN
jgi:hypothetical protein